ncbi:hypothetical protein ACHAW5_005204 [Stephanodiscus triporus]|uniref:Hemerythrin-like domain-containing protein n=1 Tax=Stephanodiscus triporus TaxID=2934178 RepID=A0ABD3N2B5_9STRA
MSSNDKITPSDLEKEETSPFKPEGLTSSVYNVENPPKDWCDVGLLLPHEAIRMEMAAMKASVEALKEDYDDAKDDWRVLYFSQWYIDIFSHVVHDHHHNEELIYFPWIATKAKVPEKLSMDHEGLVKLLTEIEDVCNDIDKKGGKKCQPEIKKLKGLVPAFVDEMRAHLQEEEATVPALVRDNFTQEEEDACVKKILKKEGTSGLRMFLPSVIVAMEEWATREYIDQFLGSIPAPLRMLYTDYYLPDYETCLRPMRDAPLLESKPSLSKTKCCKISFCIPCIF